MDEFMCIL